MIGKYIVNYIRQSQSAETLRLALSEIANLSILEEDSVLQHKYYNVFTEQTVYTFNTASFVVDYDHTALTVGTVYPKHTVIGEEYIRVTSRQAGDPEQWWRILDWTDGLPMGGPWEGLRIPDALVRYYWVSDWVDSLGATRKHIRADFDNTDAADIALQNRFWQQVHDSEERTEITLVDTDELSAVDDGVDESVNMLDFYFRNLYGDRGIVIDLRTGELGDKAHRAVMNFARREAPIGSAVLIREDGALSLDFA